MKKLFVWLFVLGLLLYASAATFIINSVYAQEVSAQVPAVTDQTPTLIRSLPNTTGDPLITLAVIVFGLIIYFVREWRKKVKRDGPNTTFRMGTWFADNWFTCLLYLLGTIILYWNAGVMHPIAAFMLGFSPAAIIDWVKKEGGSST